MYEHCATEPASARLLQDGEGAVVPDDHHLHGDALRPGLFPGQAEVEPVPGVVLHDEEGPHCGSSQQDPVSACPPNSSPSCKPGLPVPAWATALMAARMLPTAGEVNTAPAMTPVSIPFPMKPVMERGGERMLGGDLCLHALVSPTVCLVQKSTWVTFHRFFISLERSSPTSQLNSHSFHPQLFAAPLSCSPVLPTSLTCCEMIPFVCVFTWFLSPQRRREAP